MLAQERMDYIIRQLNDKGTVYVKNLAKVLQVTEVTIRRDLEEMEKQELLIRVHGGARRKARSAILSPNDETRMPDRLQIHYEEKDLICRKAASLIKDGDCVFLDGGTSILPILKYLGDKNIKIVTHSTLIQQNFESKVAELFVIGGKLIPEYKMSVGPIALEVLQKFNFDYCFIGCAGIDLQRGLIYTAEMDTMAIKDNAIKLAEQKYLLIDSSKTQVKGFCSFLHYSSFDGVICDDGILKQDVEIPDNFIIVSENVSHK